MKNLEQLRAVVAELQEEYLQKIVQRLKNGDVLSAEMAELLTYEQQKKIYLELVKHWLERTEEFIRNQHNFLNPLRVYSVPKFAFGDGVYTRRNEFYMVLGVDCASARWQYRVGSGLFSGEMEPLEDWHYEEDLSFTSWPIGMEDCQ